MTQRVCDGALSARKLYRVDGPEAPASVQPVVDEPIQQSCFRAHLLLLKNPLMPAAPNAYGVRHITVDAGRPKFHRVDGSSYRSIDLY